MSKHNLTRKLPAIIEPDRFCRNGALPQPALWQRIGRGLDHIAGYRKKMFFCQGMDLISLPESSGAGTVTQWYCYHHTGENVTKLRFMLGLATAYKSGTTFADPYADVYIGGASAGELHYARNDSLNITPADVFWGAIDCDASADTAYEIELRVTNGARIASACGYEVQENPVDDSLPGGCDPSGFLGQGQILGSGIQGLLEASTNLLKHNAAPILSWTQPYWGQQKTITSSAWTNIIDGTSTSVSSSSPGWKPHLSYHDTAARDVPVVLAVRYGVSAIGTMKARIADSGGGLLTVNLSGLAGSGWATATGTIPASTGKVDLQFQSDGTNTLSLYGAALYQYET